MTTKQNVWQAVKFALFSSSAGLIELGSFTLLNELTPLPYWPCYLIALILSVLWNFTLNRQFTFKSASNVPIAMMKIAAYYMVFTPLSTWGGQMVSNLGVNEYIILAVTMVTNLLTEFCVYRFWVFRKTMNTNKLALKQKAKAEKSDLTE
ncbi:MAG: GtrA family protein [Treponema sp.]|nr:GtrA family protein [Treponema sp.]